MQLTIWIVSACAVGLGVCCCVAAWALSRAERIRTEKAETERDAAEARANASLVGRIGVIEDALNEVKNLAGKIASVSGRRLPGSGAKPLDPTPAEGASLDEAYDRLAESDPAIAEFLDGDRHTSGPARA